MSLKKLALAGGAAAMLAGGIAQASVIDRPFFQVLGVVVVWGASTDGGTDDVVSDFALLTTGADTEAADLIAGDVFTVVTGELADIGGATSGGVFTSSDGVLDASDTLTAFGVDANTDIGSEILGTHQGKFYVASNAPFDIYAHSTVAQNTFDAAANVDASDVSMAMSIVQSGTTASGLAFGANAQIPGTVETLTNLGALGTTEADATKVFDGTVRTAATVGNLAAQSVEFNTEYAMAGYDLSMGTGVFEAEVTYTVYTP